MRKIIEKLKGLLWVDSRYYSILNSGLIIYYERQLFTGILRRKDTFSETEVIDL